jgi:hypothetical protein
MEIIWKFLVWVVNINMEKRHCSKKFRNYCLERTHHFYLFIYFHYHTTVAFKIPYLMISYSLMPLTLWRILDLQKLIKSPLVLYIINKYNLALINSSRSEVPLHGAMNQTPCSLHMGSIKNFEGIIFFICQLNHMLMLWNEIRPFRS